ncbi:MAG: HNH endonuclease [Syntrophobacteraceae bacterium]
MEIHHIVPEPQGGPGTIDNAAPLCAKHHADFGDNPHKRKVIREMRDW